MPPRYRPKDPAGAPGVIEADDLALGCDAVKEQERGWPAIPSLETETDYFRASSICF